MPVPSWSPSPLIPPFRFGTVEPDVYRGAYPKPRNLRFLKRLKLRTVLSLIPDAPDGVFQAFCTQHGIQSIHLPVDKVKDNVPLTYNRAVEALQIIINKENLPIYVHCLDGASVTGLVICCLRKLQTWNVSSALGEFLRYLRGGVISSEESAFVEKFSSEIVISKPIPSWLWEGQTTFKKHPTLKLSFAFPPARAEPHATTSSPGWSFQNTAVQLPNKQQNDSTGTSISSGAGTDGDFFSGSTVIGIGGQNAMGSSSSGVHGVSSKPGQSPNPFKNSSVKGGLRERAAHNTSTIRTDVSGSQSFGSSRTTSIATPTTAALTQNKRGMMGRLTGNKNQQGQPQESQTIDSSVSGTGVRVTTSQQPRSEAERTTPGTSGLQTIVGPHTTLVVQSEHEKIVDGAGKEGQLFGTGLRTEDISNDGSTAQDRHPNAAMKSPPAGAPASTIPTGSQETVDEYYEVSMTLKALSLEGADF
ncbi:tyrosine phosphatase family-domain-containing protein [Mortierella sp. GBAus27b]|nr:tyrosine phosphatase family-domain-containing protein [Mortierella sp. GBAus27b]